LLFTSSDLLVRETEAEVQRVLAPGGRVYLLGGESALSSGVAERLGALGYAVVRLAGPSRIETALEIADEVRRLYPGNQQVLVARAFGVEGNETAGWADSVTGGAYGAFARIPVVLTPTQGVHPALATWIARDDPSLAILLGGTAALTEDVERALPRSRRISGAERSETAAALATHLWSAPASGARQFVVINGFHPTGWAAGLAVAGTAADARAPLVVVTPLVPRATQTLVSSCGAPEVDLLVVGDIATIPAETIQELDRLDGSAC
jgi:putative cell wall-binding protein